MFRQLPEEPMVMIQSADPERYFDMLRIVARPNRDFCQRHGIRYAAVQAVLRGFHPWHACYNRIFFLNDLIDLGYRGWFLHLDADAFVHDPGFDIGSYLAGHSNRSMILVTGGSPEAWDVNDGVFFANLAHPDMPRIARLWRERLDAITPDQLRAAGDWGQLPCDQTLLQALLRDHPELTEGLFEEDPELINSPTASFLHQILRAHEQDFDHRVRRLAVHVGRSLQASGGQAEPFAVLLPALALALGVPVPDEDEAAAAAGGPEAVLPSLERLVAGFRTKRRGNPAEPAASALLLPALARALGVAPPDPEVLRNAPSERDGLVASLRAVVEAYKEVRRRERAARASA
ncbi:hypothetical protein [Roseomonas indoligenes]|uniref:Galactosyl transferase GMA12/MNN10 family protein n=1 Tax=Roseomonas indoligenes TaxID=2820811 RepID=A0A940MS24_9PROT|nr:hypothetical protein [Pararoseomonas indoligenes]MBP0493008.1 hypothetical protein [Pararoseomonas indoligenes]